VRFALLPTNPTLMLRRGERISAVGLNDASVHSPFPPAWTPCIIAKYPLKQQQRRRSHSTHVPFNHFLSLSVMGIMIPEICVTPPPTADILSPLLSISVGFVGSNAKRTLQPPPETSDYPSRHSLAQRGLRLGSYRLNCVESVRISSPVSSRPLADLASTRRTFNWSKPSATLQSVKAAPVSRTRGHTRARSLNSFAELNLKLSSGTSNDLTTPSPIRPLTNRHHQRWEPETRNMSIDLSILSHGFQCAL